MKVLVISDTHGSLENAARVLKKVRPLDLVIHLGDIMGDNEELAAMAGCPVTAVAGNNDWLSRDPKETVMSLGKYRAYLTHGHRHSVYFGCDRLVWAAREQQAEIALFGHTHVPVLDLSGDVWLMNPGSLTRPRNGSRYSYIVLDIDEDGEVHPTLCSL